jgi:hypothetical protein
MGERVRHHRRATQGLRYKEGQRRSTVFQIKEAAGATEVSMCQVYAGIAAASTQAPLSKSEKCCFPWLDVAMWEYYLLSSVNSCLEQSSGR